MSNQREITVRAKAYSHEGVRTHRVRVEGDGTVLVWDSVAGHYTSCHSLGRSAQARIRRQAQTV